MKNVLILIALLCVCLPVAAQQQSKLVEFQMALLKRPKKMPADWETASLRERHLAYIHSLMESDKLIIAGLIKDDPQLAGVLIFRTNSADEARSWATADPAAATDPAVQAGRLALQIHPWLVPEGILP